MAATAPEMRHGSAPSSPSSETPGTRGRASCAGARPSGTGRPVDLSPSALRSNAGLLPLRPHYRLERRGGGSSPALPPRPPPNVLEDLEDYFRRLDERRQMPPWRRPRTTTATRACRTSPTRTSPNWTPPPTWRATASQTAPCLAEFEAGENGAAAVRGEARLPPGARSELALALGAVPDVPRRRAEHRPRAPRAGAAVAAPARPHARRRRHPSYEPTPPPDMPRPDYIPPTSGIRLARWRLNTRSTASRASGACRGEPRQARRIWTLCAVV